MEIIRALVALQVATKQKVALPVDWPNNEMLGDKVIISPATNIEQAKQNEMSYDHYDWWFAYKDLKQQ